MPHFDYCWEVWDSLGSVLAERLQKLHNRCVRVIMRNKNETGQSELALLHLGWSLLSERRFHIKARQMFRVLHELAPVRLSNIFRNSLSANSYNLRNADNKLAVITAITANWWVPGYFKGPVPFQFLVDFIYDWNDLKLKLKWPSPGPFWLSDYPGGKSAAT